jgi:hypothetical protein
LKVNSASCWSILRRQTVHSESRCALIIGDGSDVHERRYRPEPNSVCRSLSAQGLSERTVLRCTVHKILSRNYAAEVCLH